MSNQNLFFLIIFTLFYNISPSFFFQQRIMYILIWEKYLHTFIAGVRNWAKKNLLLPMFNQIPSKHNYFGVNKSPWWIIDKTLWKPIIVWCLYLVLSYSIIFSLWETVHYLICFTSHGSTSSNSYIGTNPCCL